MRRLSTRFSIAAMAGVAVLLSACGQVNNAAESAADPEPSKISIVTSTNVYGDIARTIGGEKVQVTTIINKLSQDPHSYEPTAQDRLDLSKASLIIGNGAGYDPFLDRITKDLGVSEDRVLHAVDVAGRTGAGSTVAKPGDGPINEHFWYSMSAASRIAQEIASRLSAVDPAGAAGFSANAEKFKAEAATISDRLEAIKMRSGGEGVALTEPLPVYMLDAAGLQNRTPEAFMEASEEGNDVPPSALQSTIDVVSSADVRFLAYNDQTSTPQSEKVRKAAEAAKLPVVIFTETLPEGKTFIQWMSENAGNIDAALRS